MRDERAATHPGRPLMAVGAVISVIALAATIGLYLAKSSAGLVAAPWGLYAVGAGMAVLGNRLNRKAAGDRARDVVEAAPERWPFLAPDAGPDTCTLCALPDLDHYRQTAPECVVPFGPRFAHRDCAALRPYVPTKAERLPAAHDRGDHEIALVFGCSRCAEDELARLPVYDWFQLGIYEGPDSAVWRCTLARECPTCGARGAPWREGCRTIDANGTLVERAHQAHQERAALPMERLRRPPDIMSLFFDPDLMARPSRANDAPGILWSPAFPGVYVDPDLIDYTKE